MGFATEKLIAWNYIFYLYSLISLSFFEKLYYSLSNDKCTPELRFRNTLDLCH